jgi:hypothetical protein
VFLYDRVLGRLVCASCNPSGARPVGELDEGGVDRLAMDPTSAWRDRWVAGLIPGSTPFRNQRSWYVSRVLGDSGRLFFGSGDGLVAGDSNGREDVYEFEPVGVGGCGLAGGCVGLISAGTGGGDSAFVDASASGDDVFFLTRDRLVDSDFDHLTDLYDAHVCSSGAPCVAVPGVSPPPCSSGDGCKPAASPEPGVFSAPASATFSGAGNVPQVIAKTKPKAKPKVKPKHKVKKKVKKRKVRKKQKRRAGKARVGVGMSGVVGGGRVGVRGGV